MALFLGRLRLSKRLTSTKRGRPNYRSGLIAETTIFQSCSAVSQKTVVMDGTMGRFFFIDHFSGIISCIFFGIGAYEKTMQEMIQEKWPIKTQSSLVPECALWGIFLDHEIITEKSPRVDTLELNLTRLADGSHYSHFWEALQGHFSVALCFFFFLGSWTHHQKNSPECDRKMAQRLHPGT